MGLRINVIIVTIRKIPLRSSIPNAYCCIKSSTILEIMFHLIGIHNVNRAKLVCIPQSEKILLSHLQNSLRTSTEVAILSGGKKRFNSQPKDFIL